MRSAEQLRLLRAAVEAEQDAMAVICSRLQRLLEETSGARASDERTAAAALWLHHFYNACENVFKRIAEVFENDVGGGQWHAHLLERMCLNVPNVRAAVLRDSTRQKLDELRRFRHLVRHAYGYTLDWEKLTPLIEGLGSVMADLNNDLDAFLTWCDQLAQGLEGSP